jgi:hypothetical protein
MRHRSREIVWLAPSLIAGILGAASLAHCGGDSSNVVLDGGSHSGSSGQPAGDDATPSGDDMMMPGSGSGSGAPGDDGSTAPPGDGAAGETGTPVPPPIPVPDGGAKSDPGSVVCNGAPCDVTTGNFCCVETVDGGQQETCKPPNSVCGGLSLKCNEASDCKDGAVCCQAIVGIALLGATSCQAKCSPPYTSFQTCRTDGECGSADGGATSRCLPQVCTNAAPPRTLSIEACALPPTIGNPDGTLQTCALVQ